MANSAGHKNMMDVLQKLKRVTMEGVSVADVAIVKGVKDVGTNLNRSLYNCQSICNTALTFDAFAVRSVREGSLGEGQLVVVIFTDYDYTGNYKKYLMGDNADVTVPDASSLHSNTHGLIVGVLD